MHRSNAYLILYHKQSTSARTRFLRFGNGRVCGPDALPEDAALEAEAGLDQAGAALLIHPAMMLREAEHRLCMPRGSLEFDTGFRRILSAEGAPASVYLARFTGVDPPFEAADAVGAAFIDLIQARGLPPVELSLLRLAYEHVLG